MRSHRDEGRVYFFDLASGADRTKGLGLEPLREERSFSESHPLPLHPVDSAFELSDSYGSTQKQRQRLRNAAFALHQIVEAPGCVFTSGHDVEPPTGFRLRPAKQLHDEDGAVFR